MADESEQASRTASSSNAPEPGTEPEDPIEVAQDIIHGLLQVLAETWAELDELRAQVALSQPGPAEGKPGAETQKPRGQSKSPQADLDKLQGVLIIDDSQILRLRLKSLVESQGYEVAGMAEDGIVGAKMAVSLQPRLIILDQMMPGMSGLECLRVIRESGVQSRVVVCSGNITAALSRGFMENGADLVLAKPIQLDSFAKAVNEMMNAASS